MRSKFLVRTLGKAMGASALIFGTMGVMGVTAAHAVIDGAVQLYVAPAPVGTDGLNNCTIASNPCASIGHALSEENTLDGGTAQFGSDISIAQGTYGSGADASDTLFSVLASGNDKTTITGTGKAKKVIVQPSNCVSQDPGGVLINLTGHTGITVSNMFLNLSGCPAPSGTAVLMAGPTAGNAAVGLLIQSNAAAAITISAGAEGTAISNDIAPVSKPCTTTVKGPNTGLNARWSPPADLIVRSIPKCAGKGDASFNGVTINGNPYTATTTTLKNTIVLSSGTQPTPEIADGATVVFNTSLEVPSFLDSGIACTGAGTICAISDNTVTAGGVTYDGTHASSTPVGISVTSQATANVDGNTVSHVASITGQGVGIALEGADSTTVGQNVNDGPPRAATGNGNSLSADDIGILVDGTGTSGQSYGVNANKVSSYNKEGIVLQNLGEAGNGTLANVEQNSVGGSLEGQGLVISGDQGQKIGGPNANLASDGNTATGNGAGIIVAPSSTPNPSTGNDIWNNTADNNTTYGLLVIGNYQPFELAGPVGPESSSGNTFETNTWTGNVGVVGQAAGANVLDGTGWGGNFTPATNLLDEDAPVSVAAGTGMLTLNVQTVSGANEVVPVGTEVTISGCNATFYVKTTAASPGYGNVNASITLQTMNPALFTPGCNLDAGGPGSTTLVLNTNTASFGNNATGLNTYGSTFTTQNTCHPAGANNAPIPPNVFGSSNGSASLNSFTGGVDATYVAC